MSTPSYIPIPPSATPTAPPAAHTLPTAASLSTSPALSSSAKIPLSTHILGHGISTAGLAHALGPGYVASGTGPGSGIHGASSFGGAAPGPGPGPAIASLPGSGSGPGSTDGPSAASRLFASTTSGLSSNVSDLLLSTLLPSNLPKLPPGATAGAGAGGASGNGARLGPRPRELSTQREALSLNVMSNNFRRFVTRVGPVFWMQDRIEEVLFWRKPMWTWAWLLAWTAISFQPRLLLLAPLLLCLLILLQTSERAHPIASLLGVAVPPTSAGTVRTTAGHAVAAGASGDIPHVPGLGTQGAGAGVSLTAGTEGDGAGGAGAIPAVPPKEAESGVDYYMNLQAIQNTMGWVSDAYDDVAPILAFLLNTATPSPTPMSAGTTRPPLLPLTPTHLLLLLLPPCALLPLLPPSFIPYILLPLGWLPTLQYHPALAPRIAALPRHPVVRRLLAIATDALLTDALDDTVGRHLVRRVEVWENERLDPAAPAPAPSSASGVSGVLGGGSGGLGQGWSLRFLRAGERLPWVKMKTVRDRLGREVGVGVSTAGAGAVAGSGEGEEVGAACPWISPDEVIGAAGDVGPKGTGAGMGKEQGRETGVGVLRLKDEWAWVPGEEWRVDVLGVWSDVGVDGDGWQYTDDSWQNPAPTPFADADTAGPMPALRRSTRRRKWWRRVYRVEGDERPDSDGRVPAPVAAAVQSVDEKKA